MKESRCFLCRLHSSFSWEVDRDGLIFNILSGLNSIFLTQGEVGLATQRLVEGLFWVSLTMSSNGDTLGGGF